MDYVRKNMRRPNGMIDGLYNRMQEDGVDAMEGSH